MSKYKDKILLGILVMVGLAYVFLVGVDVNSLKPIMLDVVKYSIPTTLLAIVAAILLSLIKSETVKNIIGMFILFLATLISPVWVRKTSFHHQIVVLLIAVIFVTTGIISDRIIQKKRGR